MSTSTASLRRYLWRYEVKRSRVALAEEERTTYAGHAFAGPEAVAAAFRGIVGDAPREHFLAFYLDARNCIMGFETIAIGGCSSVEVEPAQVFRGALLAGAFRLIVAHNHPSGDATPSEADVQLTSRLIEASRLIGIPVLDHVVVAATAAYSFAEGGHVR